MGDGCAFCEIVAGTRAAHVVYEDARVVAFMDGYRQPRDAAHVLVIPKAHIENLYGIGDELGAALFAAHARVARAVKREFAPDGITTWASNEPAAGQEVMQYHVHVFPRRTGVALTADVPKDLTTPLGDDLLGPNAERIRKALALLR